nr:reverse transcriptase domain-containing protein [Tanacetum cinerariifolium]
TGRSTQRQIHKREGGGNGNRERRTDLDDTDSELFKRRNSPRRQEGGKKAPPQGPTIRINRGNSLQAVVPYAVVKMCWTAPGGSYPQRLECLCIVLHDEELRLNLDLLEERRERAAICEAKAKSKMTKYYNARVRGVTFKPCDFVYRSNDASHAVAGGKLGLKWEGPYEITEALGDGAYKLRSMDETILPRTWNIANLKRCYL